MSCQNLQAGFFEKDFSYELPLDTLEKTYYLTVDSPANPSEFIIGRDFSLVIDKSKATIKMIRETLTKTNYSAEIRIKRNPKQSPANCVGKVLLKLYTGAKVLNDTPQPPFMVSMFSGLYPGFSWRGRGDAAKSEPVSARYLSYSLREAGTKALIAEEIVPVHETGFKISGDWLLDPLTDYILEVELSNRSAVYSAPTVVNAKRAQGLKSLKMGK